MNDLDEQLSSYERARQELAQRREALEKAYRAHREFDKKALQVKQKYVFPTPYRIESWRKT